MVVLSLVSLGLLGTNAFSKSNDVKEVQELLNVLGYEEGVADGISGRNTLRAIESFYEDIGGNFSGKISKEDISSLNLVLSGGTRINWSQKGGSLKIPTIVNASEGYLNNMGDLNDDGVDDFLVSYMIDPSAYGSQFYATSKTEAANLPYTPTYLFYSLPNGHFNYIVLPEEVWSKRMWAAESFTLGKDTFIVLGRNGEIGQPEENPGERIAIVQIKFDKFQPHFPKIYFEDYNTVTSAVDIFYVEPDFVHIVVSNYNEIKAKPHNIYDSVIFKFSQDSGITLSDLDPYSKRNIAHNSVVVEDINGDNKLDFLAGTEVWLSHDEEAKIKSPSVGSYIVLDWLNTRMGDFDSEITLSPKYGFEHAGSHVNFVDLKRMRYLVETSGRFLGYKNANPYRDSSITFYRFPDSSRRRVTEIQQSFELDLERANQSKTFVLDIDGDEISEVFLNNYTKNKHYFKWVNGKWKKIELEHKLLSLDGTKTSILIKDRNYNCVRLVSTLLYMNAYNQKNRDDPNSPLEISDCKGFTN